MSEFLISNAWLVPALPLLGALLTTLTARRLEERCAYPVIAGIGLAFAVSLGLLFSAGPEAKTLVHPWIEAGGLKAPIEFRVDGLTTVMLSMVTFVSSMVAIFALGYMAGDPGFARFFAVVGLFVASMTGLVLSGNYLLTYAFWEGVGVCSYLLIGFWHAKPAAAAAAKKAFLVNRVGDVGFAVAIFWMWVVSDNHDLSYEVFLGGANLKIIPYVAIYGISFLLFWAATAKSAQLPLYVWLPDAMEGPTPVSALIHAATMVTAGVYLVARSMPLIVLAPLAQMTICLVGALTALLSAAIALTQTDLKRVLAYSTVSQLGYMFMALGAGVGDVAQFALVAGIFHLFTHAFFKALLFLGSGSVMHAMGHVIDMRRFGGLRRRMPVTCATFAVGALALSGIVPFAGFFSKDEILIALKSASQWMEHDKDLNYPGFYLAIYWLAILTAFLTAFYTGRAFFKTFFGDEKLPSPDDPEAAEADAHHGDEGGDHHSHDHAHDDHFGRESSPVMTIPLVILAVCALLVGLGFGPTGLFEHKLSESFGFERLSHAEHHPRDPITPWLGLGVGVAGLVLSYFLYGRPSDIPNRMASTLRPLYNASLNKFRVDEFYTATVVKPLLVLSKVVEFFDIYFVDGLVRLAGWFPRAFGRGLLAPFQNGLVQYYAAMSAIGLACLLWVLLLR